MTARFNLTRGSPGPPFRGVYQWWTRLGRQMPNFIDVKFEGLGFLHWKPGPTVFQSTS